MSRDRTRALSGWTLVLALCVAAPSRASWAPDGNLLVPDSRVPSLPLPIAGVGGVYIEWLDGGSGYNFDLRLSRWTSRGNVADGWTQISSIPGGRGNMITDGGLRKYDPCATADGADHALFAWSDDRDHISKQVYAGRAVPAGVPAAGWTTNGVRLAATSADQVTPAIAADAAGGAFVAWQDFRGVDADIYLQHVDSSGTVSAGWPALGFPVAALPGIQSAPVVATDDAGGVFVAWRDRRAGNDDVYLQHVGAGGSIAPGWTANGVAICSASGSQSVISIVRDGTGGVFVAWQDQRSVGLDIYATRIQSSGVPAPGWSAGGSPISVASGDQVTPRAAADGTGGLLLAWQDHRGPDWDIYALRVQAGGTRESGWPLDGLGVATAAGDQTAPDLLADGSGGAYLTWQDRGPADADIRAMHLAGDGAPAIGWNAGGAAICTAAGDQTGPRICGNGPDACVIWQDLRSGSLVPCVYGQWLRPDGPIPVRPRGLSAAHHDGQTFLTWVPPPDTGWTYRVYCSSSPIASDADLASATLLGTVGDSAATDRRLSQVMGGLYSFRPDSAAAFLPPDAGLYVVTAPADRAVSYAVTSQLGALPEDRHVVPAGNALDFRVQESLAMPRPVFQRQITTIYDTADVYTLWTWATDTPLPAICNRASWPFDCGVTHGAPGGGGFVRMHQHSGDFTKQLSVTGLASEWVLAPDDYVPNKDVSTYWYGYDPGYDITANGNSPPLGGQIVDYTNRRVLYTIQWWRRTFAVDPTRVYAFGISLGGACSMRLALTHPELIVAAMSIVGKADFSFESDPDTESAFNTGKYYRHQLEKLWGSTAADLPSAEGPPIYTMVNDGALAARMAAQGDAFILNVSGRHDTIIGWAEKLGYFAGMEASHHGFMEFWDSRDHANQIYPAAMSPMSNPAYLYRFRSDLSWPAFSRCSADADPGDGTPAMGDTLGTINGFMDWDPGVTETPTSWGVTLLTRPVTTLWGTLPAPALLTVDVTPRRAQQFRPAPGRLVHWTATRVSDAALLQSDSVFTDSVGLVTIPSVKTYHFGTRLELTGPPPNTGAPPDARPELRLGPLANPVRGRAVIAGSWAHDGPARVELFDASGRIARAIWRGAARAGAWRVEADLAGLAPGVYLLRAEQGGARRVRRLVVLR